jgi:hypothetical protein
MRFYWGYPDDHFLPCKHCGELPEETRFGSIVTLVCSDIRCAMEHDMQSYVNYTARQRLFFWNERNKEEKQS